MSDAVGEVEVFERVRPRLRAIAYRMLGSVEDAEDVVQETFLRWHSAPREQIESPERWLATVCVRLGIDALRMAYRKRESYIGPWLPEPVLGGAAGEGSPDPVELAESLTMAFLLMLERLSPVERAAFLLHDVFGYAYAEVAETLGRSEPACRQIVSRARKRVSRGEARFSVDPQRAEELLARFTAAARAGEVEQLRSMLAADAELWTDGGGKVTAARNVIRGADPVARFFAGIGGKVAPGTRLVPAQVNGSPGLLVYHGASLTAVVCVDLDAAGRLERVYVVSNPDKLRPLGDARGGPSGLPAAGVDG